MVKDHQYLYCIWQLFYLRFQIVHFDFKILKNTISTSGIHPEYSKTYSSPRYMRNQYFRYIFRVWFMTDSGRLLNFLYILSQFSIYETLKWSLFWFLIQMNWITIIMNCDTDPFMSIKWYNNLDIMNHTVIRKSYRIWHRLKPPLDQFTNSLTHKKQKIIPIHLQWSLRDHDGNRMICVNTLFNRENISLFHDHRICRLFWDWYS